MLDMLSSDYAAEVCPEQCRALFRSVIIQALRDAAGAIGTGAEMKEKGARDQARRQARLWFDVSDPDYVMVCDLAGVDPVRLQRRYNSGDIPESALRMQMINTRGGDKQRNTVEDVFDALKAKPRATVRDIVTETGMGERAAVYALDRLREAGRAVRCPSVGRAHLWRAVE